MTSSSDARRPATHDLPAWRPLELGAPAAHPVPPAARFAEAFGPGAATATAGPEWLAPLRTDAENRSEARTSAALEAAHARGLEEGTRNERARADERCRTALEAVARAAAHLDEIAAEFARDRERDVHGLAVAVARQIVQHELTIDPLRVGELVRRALELLPLDPAIEVRLNPADLATLADSLEGAVPPGRQVRVQWLSDPSLERGGFVIETPHRVVDGRADVALRTLYERLDRD